MKNKKAEKILYRAGVIVTVLVLAAGLVISLNPERSYRVPDREIVSESESISTVNLCVVKKSRYPGGMTGMFNRYYLVLSNDMAVYVTAKEFEEYEENQYYDFELVEKTTVSSRIRLISQETE